MTRFFSQRALRVAASLLVLGAGREAVAQQNGNGSGIHPTPPPVVRAGAATVPIRLDGRLDEPVWQSVPAASDFIQSQPNEGQPATQRTEVRILFGDDAIYVGARMYDDLGAKGVVSRLVRRDARSEADELSITFDTFHDHLGTTRFTINPAGVRGDAYGPGGANADQSWDPVWEAETQIDSLGWTAEMRIPLSQLRFRRDTLQTWGMQVVRFVNRLNERSHWAFWELNESGGPSRYGHLEGLELRRAPGKAEFLPYVVGRSANRPPGDPRDPFDDPNALDYRVGVDMTYHLNSNLTLTATVNPDFGQVEVDPAVVNLSAFETFFSERRPFFVEGQGFLRFGSLWCFFCSNTSSLSMFHSRRVGRSPQVVSNAFDRGDFADVPDNTTILGSAKVTGRTPSGWSVGIVDAVTSRERATVALSGGGIGEAEVEPFTNYFIGRVSKDLRGGDWQIAALGASVVRSFGDPALRDRLPTHSEGGGIAAEGWWGKRTYHFLGQAAFTQVSGDPTAMLRIQRSSARYFQRPDRGQGGNGLLTDRYDSSLTSMRGVGLYSRIAKDAGDWRWETSVNLRTPGFENNDYAFLTRADYVWMSGNIHRQFTKPTNAYRWLSFTLGAQQQYNFDGDLNDRQFHGSAFWQLPNYWELFGFWIHRPRVLDERLARGGPVLTRARNNFWLMSFSTDTRKNVAFNMEPTLGCDEDGNCDYGVSTGVTVRPASNVSVQLSPSFNHSERSDQYVAAVDDPTATAFFGRRYVFADLTSNQLSMNTRVNVTFTPDLSLEVFLQPLISSNRFDRYKEFTAPRTREFRVFGEDAGTVSRSDQTVSLDPDGAGPASSFSFGDPTFNFRSLRGNAVLRWEFRPGSTLFLVWTQSRSGDAPVGDFRFGRDIRALFDADAENIFLIKFNYWLGI